MVRTIVTNESLLQYLTKDTDNDNCIVGLILGQYTPTKDYVIHFAKTPPFNSNSQEGTVNLERGFKLIADISVSWMADHAKHATRLLPGGMYVLGFFIVSNEDPFDDKNVCKVKNIVLDIYKQLDSNIYFHGNPPIVEKVVLHYCSNTKVRSCMSIDPLSGSIKPADFKFLSNKIPWFSVECFYELSQIFPIQEKEVDLSLKKHMTKILESITANLKTAVFLYDGLPKNKSDILEWHMKDKPLQVSIILPSDCGDLPHKVEIRNCGGHITLSGQIASKVWVHQNMTVGAVSDAIIQDIIRSLSARLEMHWDSLIEEEHGSPEDTNSIHEPPRRIFVKLPESELTLSDYLFPGEGPREAEISLEELLDITVDEEEAILDVEGQADLTEFYKDNLEVDSEDALPRLPGGDTNRFMYMTGLGVALLVLLISLLVHFFQNVL